MATDRLLVDTSYYPINITDNNARKEWTKIEHIKAK